MSDFLNDQITEIENQEMKIRQEQEIQNNLEIQKLLDDQITILERQEEITEKLKETLGDTIDKVEIKQLLDEQILLIEKQNENKIKMDEFDERQEDNPDQEDETSFIEEWEGYSHQFFLDKIDDPIIKQRTEEALKDFGDKDNPEHIKNSVTKGISSLSNQDELDTSLWYSFIITEEHKKHEYEQKVKNLNSVLVDKELHIDYRDKTIHDFLEQNVQHTLTPKGKEINGYKYRGRLSSNEIE